MNDSIFRVRFYEGAGIRNRPHHVNCEEIMIMYKLIRKSLCLLVAMLFLLCVFPAGASAERAGIRDGVLVNGGVPVMMTNSTVQLLSNDAFELDDDYPSDSAVNNNRSEEHTSELQSRE